MTLKRSLISVSGPDHMTFLQGLITNDVLKTESSHLVYSLMLTPQGRYLFDFFIFKTSQGVCIDIATENKDKFMQRLRVYQLRADVKVEDVSERWKVIVFPPTTEDPSSGALSLGLGEIQPYKGGILAQDPRVSSLGLRLYSSIDDRDQDAFDRFGMSLSEEAYHKRCTQDGIPLDIHDFIPEKTIPLEYRMDLLNAIDWDKGCYLGQELTARTKYRGEVHKYLYPFDIIGPTPAFRDSIYLDGVKVGAMRGSCEDKGLGLLRKSFVDQAMQQGKKLTCGQAFLIPYHPGWASTTAES